MGVEVMNVANHLNVHN